MEPVEIALSAIRVRVTKVFPAQIHAAVEPLTDEQLWWRPNESSNSIANLVLHLTGSLNHYLNRAFGGFEYERDRAKEFAERTNIPKAEVLAAFDEMVAHADKTFDSFTIERLSDPSPEPRMNRIVLEDLLNVLSHVSTHTGQILWIAKSFRDGALNDVWMHSHRDQGAWRG